MRSLRAVPDKLDILRRPVLLAVALAFIAGGAWAKGEPADEKLRAVVDDIAKAQIRHQTLEVEVRNLDRELADLRQRQIQAAAEVQRHETRASAVESRIDEIDGDIERMGTTLKAQRHDLALTLGALQRLRRQPPEALIATQNSAVDTLRSAFLLGGVVPELDRRVARVEQTLARLADLRRAGEEERQSLAATLAALNTTKTELQTLRETKQRLMDQQVDERRKSQTRLTALSSEAATLRALLQSLAEEKAAREKAEEEKRRLAALGPSSAAGDAARRALEQSPAKDNAGIEQASALRRVPITPMSMLSSFASARGKLTRPVRGRVVRRFGQNDAKGLPTKGILMETRDQAQVVAPFDGKVVFAGPFRSYGQLLIIEHGEGYHSLLAGMSRIDGEVGQLLLAGEPVGEMPSGRDTKPILYIELRQNGNPINPLLWLSASERKVSG